jgi:cytochrome c
MKKTIFLMAMIAAIWSCNNNKSSSNDATGNNGAGTGTGPGAGIDTAQTTAGATGGANKSTADLSNNPDYVKGRDLVTKSDCLTCHKENEKLIGPAYADVAARYAGKPGIEDSLANKVIHGGSGNWGQVPMTAHPQLSHEDAVAMVKYVLLLKK